MAEVAGPGHEHVSAATGGDVHAGGDSAVVEGLRGGVERERAGRRAMRLPAGAALDRLAGLAARLLGAPAAQLSLLSDEQLVAAASGLAAPSIGSRGPLADSLCRSPPPPRLPWSSSTRATTSASTACRP